MLKIYASILRTPIGILGICISEDRLIKIDYLKRSIPLKNTLSPKIKIIAEQLDEYFKKPQHRFKLPLKLQGTPLQIRIWQLIRKIPSGKTVTYGKLAKKIGTNPRIIGNACRHNPIPIIIPCHRVVSKQNLGGYCGKNQGKMSAIKKWLIKHELDSSSL